MKTTALSNSLRTIVAVSLLGLGAAAFASPSVAPAAADQASSADRADKKERPGHHGKEQGPGHQRDAALWVPGYGPLGAEFVKSLALNEQQTTLLTSAQTAQQELQKARHELRRTLMKEQTQALQAGKPDPRAALQQMESQHEAMQVQSRKVQQQWLAVWDALTPEQQQKVALQLQQRDKKHQDRVKAHADAKAS